MRTKHTFRLPPDLGLKLADYASRKRVPQAHVVETALASFLSPDASERLEGALGRRLDRLVRQVERLERNVTISNEALALFVGGDSGHGRIAETLTRNAQQQRDIAPGDLEGIDQRGHVGAVDISLRAILFAAESIRAGQ